MESLDNVTIGPGTLEITAMYGRSLAPKDPNGKSDPFCVFGFWNSAGKSMEGLTHKTKYKKATLNPQWSDKDRNQHKFILKTPLSIPFKFEVWDYDHVGESDYMGEVNIPPLKFIENYVCQRTHPMEKKQGYKGKVSGTVTFSWSYEPSPEVKQKEQTIREKLANIARPTSLNSPPKTSKTPHDSGTNPPPETTTTTTTTTTSSTSTTTTTPTVPTVSIVVNTDIQSEHTALETLRHKALLGDVEAAFELGKKYAVGDPQFHIETDDKEALKYYMIAAEAGHSVAQFKVGLFLQMGYGCESNHSRALVWYEKAVSQDQPDALCAIGEVYESGWVVDVDIDKALKYYHRASELGEKDSLSALGRIYKERAAKDSSLWPHAIEYLTKASPHSSESAYILGKMYEDGEGVPKDVNKAVQLYKLAAEDEDHEESHEALARLGHK